MRVPFFSAVLFGLLLAAQPAAAFFGLFDSHEKTSPQQGEVRLDVSGLKAEDAKFYRLEQDGVQIRFFLVRDKQNKIHTALDACDVCWKEAKGYKLDKNAMLCVNCGMKFPLSRIGLKSGGCNPHPVQFSEDGDTVIISADELLAGASYFSGEGK